MPDQPGTSTIRDVELLSVGEWPASAGDGRITREDLEAVLAAAEDTDLDAPAIRLGHLDPRFDGEPAMGWVRPTRIVEARQDGKRIPTLVGDLVGMPSKLAAVAPTAWRRRSVELAWNVKTAAGRTHRAALVGLALLGVAAPAVKGLADVLALYADATTPPEGDRSARLEYVDGLEDQPSAVAMLAAARTAGATAAQLDAMAAAAGARDTATLPQPEPDAPEDDSHTSPAPNPGGPRMSRTLTDVELRSILEREADVDVEATLAAIRASEQEPEQEPEQPAEEPAPGESDPAEGRPDQGQPPNPTDPNEPAGSTEEPQLVTLSAGQWSDVQRELEWARTRRRGEVLDEAIRAGRIAPSERSTFAAALERDEEGTRTLLTSLAAGRVPLEERGYDAAPDARPDDAAWDTFGESLGLGKLSS